MAKIVSPFGTSPISSFFNELTPNGFVEDFHEINPDPFDIFEDLPSICSDIQKIESDPFLYGGGIDMDFDMKPELRNTDLMWWTAPTPVTTNSANSSSSTSSVFETAGVSLAAVMGAASPTQQTTTLKIKVEKEEEDYAPTIVTAKKTNPLNFNDKAIINIKQEPTDDVEQQLAYNSIPNTKTTATSAQQSTGIIPISTSMQNIPPGTSLLRKSQQLTQQKKSPQQIRGTLHITKRGDQLLPSANTNDTSSLFNTTTSSIDSPNSSLLYQRPDTPHSLDDDFSTPEFRHNVDLRACVMGSNNISLTTDQDFIRHVTEELKDMNKVQIDTRLSVGSLTLSEVLEVISNSPTAQELFNLQNTTTSALTPNTTCSSTCSYQSTNTNGSMRSSDIDSDEESTMDSSSCSLMDHDLTYNAGGVSPVSSQTSNTQHYMQHRDHSYTRCKDGIDDISTNLETPSDSEEEIDVVSINDKKLPTNPSDKDRRVLQTKVAHKFNASRIVQTARGVRTIPPRRGSYELPYTPVSSSPAKSLNNSRFPSPAVTPYQNQYTTKYVQQQQMLVVGDMPSTVNVFSSGDKTRKRLLVSGGNTGSNILNHSNLNGNIIPNKKHRGKKTKLVTAAVQLHNGLKRQYSIDETADTIEKRNLHNDMERQRRIGLKNLFEALKKQIPSIKDKERAPKVNILREAAKLCEALTREEYHLTEHKAKLKEEVRRKQELIAQLKAERQHIA